MATPEQKEKNKQKNYRWEKPKISGNGGKGPNQGPMKIIELTEELIMEEIISHAKEPVKSGCKKIKKISL